MSSNLKNALHVLSSTNLHTIHAAVTTIAVALTFYFRVVLVSYLVYLTMCRF